MSFRLVPKSVTLNGVMAVILRYFSEFGYLSGVLHKSSRSSSHLLVVLKKVSTLVENFRQYSGGTADAASENSVFLSFSAGSSM